MSDETTDFGFTQVPIKEKQQRVNQVFSSVAKNYDVMNDLMSLGLHHIWKRQAVQLARIKGHHHILDLAGGSGDLSKLMAQKAPPEHIVLADINFDMLQVGRDKLIDHGLSQIKFCTSNAESLPFQSHSFDRVMISFGLRNVTNKAVAIKEMSRVLKPGGMLIVLEFSQVNPRLQGLYDLYSFKVLPKLGEIVAKDKPSYEYLAESIRKHPDQETLKQMILEQGFKECEYFNLNFGIVAIHRAYT